MPHLKAHEFKTIVDQLEQAKFKFDDHLTALNAEDQSSNMHAIYWTAECIDRMNELLFVLINRTAKE
jgi:hypothetical protein